MNLKEIKIYNFLIAGLKAGIISLILNNIYYFVFNSSSAIDYSEIITYGSTSGASIIITIIGAIFYFLISRFTDKSTLIFQIVGGLFAIVSCAGAFGETLQDGSPMPVDFAYLSVPMHIITGFIAITLIPKFISK